MLNPNFASVARMPLPHPPTTPRYSRVELHSFRRHRAGTAELQQQIYEEVGRCPVAKVPFEMP